MGEDFPTFMSSWPWP